MAQKNKTPPKINCLRILTLSKNEDSGKEKDILNFFFKPLRPFIYRL
jgi:hypothetical protein